MGLKYKHSRTRAARDCDACGGTSGCQDCREVNSLLTDVEDGNLIDEEGDLCPECGRARLQIIAGNHGCTCHCGHPPCTACVELRPKCPDCGFEAEYYDR